jgi:hypothetical protein
MSEQINLDLLTRRIADLKSENDELRASVAPPVLKSGGPSGTSGDMDEGRLTKLEGLFDGFRAVPQLAVTALGIAMGALAIVVTIAIFQFNSLSGRIGDLTNKVDAIPRQLTEEFRAMRAESAAQTSAIANSISAVRQVQPQIMVLPTPVQSPPKGVEGRP